MLQEQAQSPVQVGIIISAIAGLIGAVALLIRTLAIKYGETKLQIWKDEHQAAIKADQYHLDRASWREDKYFDILTAHMEALEKFLTGQQAELHLMSLTMQNLTEALKSQNEILSELYEVLHSYLKHKPKTTH